MNQIKIKITFNDTVFAIFKETCAGCEKAVLYDMINLKEGNNVIIPSKFPTGEKIDVIGKYVYNQGMSKSCGTVTISNEIRTVRKEAFGGLEAKKVVWSSGCREIPYRCFANSSIFEISNIQDVTSIESEAFAATNIESIAWPQNCHEIPMFCFDMSGIKEILNIEEVTKIGASAFSNSSLERISWPPRCPVVPDGCFHNSSLEELPDLSNVFEIGANAFSYTHIGKIDLSKTMVARIGKRAFAGYNETKVIYPYYMEATQ